MAIDPKTARGLARDINAELVGDSRAVTACVRRVLRDMAERGAKGRKTRGKDFDEPARRLQRKLAGNAATSAFEFRELGRTGEGWLHVRYLFSEEHRTAGGYMETNYGLKCLTVRATAKRMTARLWLAPAYLSHHLVERAVERLEAETGRPAGAREIARIADDAALASVIWMRAIATWRLPVEGHIALPAADGHALAGYLSAMNPRLVAGVQEFVVDRHGPRTYDLFAEESWWQAVKLKTFVNYQLLHLNQDAAIAASQRVLDEARPFLTLHPEMAYAWPGVDDLELEPFRYYKSVLDFYEAAVRETRLHRNFRDRAASLPEDPDDAGRRRAIRRMARDSALDRLWPSALRPDVEARKQARLEQMERARAEAACAAGEEAGAERAAESTDA